MTEPTNKDRANWAFVGVKAFAEETGLDIAPEADGLETAISDFLVDLLHLCDVNELDFAELESRALRAYRDELWEEMKP